MWNQILNGFESVLHIMAELTACILEIIGILILIVGAVRVLIRTIIRLKNRESAPQNVIIALGRTLALALEFKMGAEIVNTVIIRDLKELAVLAIIIALRAILALLIHWEIKTEREEEHELEAELERKHELEAAKDNKKSDT